MIDVSRGAGFLEQSLLSLSAQTFTDFEIVLLAHGAEPDVLTLLRKFEAHEPRLRVFHSSKLPLAQAHNRIAREARAPLLARLDGDDMAKPHRLERQVAMFASDRDLGFAGSAVEIIDDANRLQSTVRNPIGHAAIVAALDHSCPIVHSTLMVRTEAFWRAGGYRQGLNISEDYDLYCRLAEIVRAGNERESLVFYRVHKRSLTSNRALSMAIANEVVRAARKARRLGLREPFVNGTPSLRLVADLTGQNRLAVRRGVRATARQSSFSRHLLTGWLPLRLRGWARSLAIGMGLRPIYAGLFRLLQRLAEITRRRR